MRFEKDVEQAFWRPSAAFEPVGNRVDLRHPFDIRCRTTLLLALNQLQAALAFEIDPVCRLL